MPMSPDDLADFEDLYEEWVARSEDGLDLAREGKIEFKLNSEDLDFLKKNGINLTQERLAPILRTTKEDGTSPRMLVKVANQFNIYDSHFVNGNLYMLQRLKTSGKNIIVDWMDGVTNDSGHYSVFMGEDSNFVYLQDPAWGTYEVMRKSVFERQWFDFENGKKINKWALILK